jgi:hypothetical protein
MGRVFLRYNCQNIQDGYFSQLQRQIGIFTISKLFRFEYIHAKICDVTVTPLDIFQTKSEISKFLETMNTLFDLPSSSKVPKNQLNIELTAPSIIQLLRFKIYSIFNTKDLVLYITIPYRIAEKRIFINRLTNTVALFGNPSLSKSSSKKVVLHIRRGVALGHILPGEKTPRVLNDEYFNSVLLKMKEKGLDFKNTSFIVLTDAPNEPYFYKPITKDKEKWKEFSEFESENGIAIQAHEFQNLQNLIGSNLKIIRGGSLQDAVAEMSSADVFVMSRSSMSYIGALLNKHGEIYYPPDFWHKPLKKWIKIK